MFDYKLAGKEFSCNFGMLFLLDHLWPLTNGSEELSMSDYVAVCMFYGNKVYAKLNSVKPAFDSMAECYAALEAAYMTSEGVEFVNKIQEDVKSTQAYKSAFELAQEAVQEDVSEEEKKSDLISTT
jgi:hypothetical protein